MIMIPSNVIDTVGGSATCAADIEKKREREKLRFTASILSRGRNDVSPPSP